MGIVVIGGGGGGGQDPKRLSDDGASLMNSDGQTVAVFPQTAEGRKAARRYLKLLDNEAPLGADET
jgi:hypothetical protein